MTVATQLRARAAAKINLHLGVGGLRDDGYHELHTVYQAISLYDDLTATGAAGWTLTCRAREYVDPATVPSPDDNIVTRAALLLAARHDIDVAADVLVDKAIPVAGGLAGGSADAAATLVVLDRAVGAQTPTRRADAARRRARQRRAVRAARRHRPRHRPRRARRARSPTRATGGGSSSPGRRGLSTPAVYRHFDDMVPDAAPVPPRADALLAALATGDPRPLAAALHNDLQEAAFDLRPDAAGADRARRVRGRAAGPGLRLRARPACSCASPRRTPATVADGLRDTGHVTALTAYGPAPGARLPDAG